MVANSLTMLCFVVWCLSWLVFQKVMILVCFILTTGHLKDPAGGPEHSQTQHGAVEVELILGKSSFDAHVDEDWTL